MSISENKKAQVASPFAHFSTDTKREEAGVWLNFGDYGFHVRRLGAGNKRFKKMLEIESRPHLALIRRNKLDEETSDAINLKVFASTVLISWRRAEKDADGKFVKWVDGMMPSKTGEDIPFTVENACDLLKQLPELFAELFDLASTASTFAAEDEAQVAKN